MKPRFRSGLRLGVGLSTIALFASLVPAHQSLARGVAAPARSSSHPCVTAIGSGDTPFVRNFNPYAAILDFSVGAIYEPLAIYTPDGKTHMWLASKWKWNKSNKVLTISVRKGVKWSDGKPFTSKDVVFSLEGGKTMDPSYDKIGYTSKPSNVASIRAKGAYTVVITLKKPDSNFITSLENQWIVPQHIWSKQKNPTKWTDPNPVGTGPFTKITRFNNQEYVLSRNPHYWQKIHVNCLERLYESGNDSAMLSMIKGQADWTHNFVPNAQKVYVSHDPKHYHYWYAAWLPDFLFMDDTKYPYSVKAFREAVSMAIDRPAVTKHGEYGYDPPSDALGLSRFMPGWIDPKLKKLDKKLVSYNPKAAKALLKKAGFTYKGSQLVDPHGNNVTMTAEVIAGWTDWVASLHIISANLAAIGVTLNVKNDPDWGTWYPVATSQSNSTLMWTYLGLGNTTPYELFNEFLNPTSKTASGTDESASGDWAHFADGKATPLLNAFKATNNAKQQKKIAYKLEKIWLNDFPAVPVFDGANWYTYSTKYFKGWPSKKAPYADGEWGAGTFNWMPILTHLKPV